MGKSVSSVGGLYDRVEWVGGVHLSTVIKNTVYRVLKGFKMLCLYIYDIIYISTNYLHVLLKQE